MIHHPSISVAGPALWHPPACPARKECVAMKKPVVLLLVLVVPWLCLFASAAAYDFPQLTFSTVWVTPEKYNTFIFSLRETLLSTTQGKSNGIPVLLSQDDPAAQQTFLNITLTNKAGYSISLKMDVAGAFFTAYVAGKYTCLLKRSGGAFSSATCYSDPWSSSVATPLLQSSTSPAAGQDHLEAAAVAAAKIWRAKDLDDAISSLFLFPTGNATQDDLSRGVAACDIMIATAAKIPYIQRRMNAGMWDGASSCVSNDLSLQVLEQQWPALSAEVQKSHQGAFPAPVTVQRSNGDSLLVDSVRRAVPLLSFVEHDRCKTTKALPQAIRSVVPEAEEMVGGAPAAACGQAEPTMHIVGAEGKCVDVPYSSYVSGTQVILWPCRSNDYDDMNQLWTFKRDGTIRCNGMCLTAFSARPAGRRVVIDDCSTVPTRRIVWEVRADGTIALKSTGLVLAVTSSADRTGVTLQADDRGTGQSWTPTNDTAPMVVNLLGYRDLYLQVNAAGAVVIGGGAAGWAVYPDGSIRPGGGSGCLAPNAAGRVVVVSPCNLAGSANQRWVFRNDGTVFNSGTGRVMDVRPPLAEEGQGCSKQRITELEVIVTPATGSTTQTWFIML